MEDLFKIWDKIQSINIDFVIFIFVVIFILKFKDIFELIFRYSTHRTEQLNAAKKLLEDSGYANSKEMAMIKVMMKYHAIKIATSLINEKHGNLYCYLFSKCTEDEMHGLHKVVPFIEIKDNQFYFNDNALMKKKLAGGIIIFVIICINIYISTMFKGELDINLSWLFYSLIIIEAIFAFYWWAKIMPDDIEVKNTKQLLEKTDIDEFNKY
ncbi:hypothetical protein B4923_14415 [Brenneria roseae subsp. americana]|uniref:Uncharacterized protein n=1 Tax=Brenneria roseae subsp. americana TaxID=1508507 RepID=A0A2U1TNW2_9GAMM|nr:hypothetical protein [Brenneria roseae]PWC11088.1 hypothetical protein B4923_14415 [Brenneria roseae subsp. americana]